MRRMRVGVLSMALASLFGCQGGPIDVSEQDYSQEFEQVWADFDLNYSYFIHKSIDWDEIRGRHEPLVAEEVTYEDFLFTVLKPMLTELSDLHVRLYSRDGYQVPLYSDSYITN